MGVTRLGIRYPDLDSSSIATDLQNMMSDIDSIGKSIQTLAESMKARDGFYVRGGTRTAGSGTYGTLAFTSTRYDTGTHWVIGSPSVITLDAGYWLFCARMYVTAAAGNISVATAWSSASGFLCMQHSVTTGLWNTVDIEMSTVVKVDNAGTTSNITAGAVTSGGANYTVSDGEFIAHRLRPL